MSSVQRLLSTPRSNSREMVSFVKRGVRGEICRKGRSDSHIYRDKSAEKLLITQIHRGTKFLILRVHLSLRYLDRISGYLGSMTLFFFPLFLTRTKGEPAKLS